MDKKKEEKPIKQNKKRICITVDVIDLERVEEVRKAFPEFNPSVSMIFRMGITELWKKFDAQQGYQNQ